MKILIKLGGTLLDFDESRERLAREITAASHHHSVAVVHGGGKQMTRYLTAHGIESRFVDGQRVTTDEVLDAVLKVFAGSVNAQLVSSFRAAGASAVGLSGMDAGIMDAVPLDPALGHVGKPVNSDTRLLDLLIEERYLPVIACVAGDADGNMYNVNGDQTAAAIGAAFGADMLIFLTDVDGVRGGDAAILPKLTAAEALDLIAAGVATAGMQAKLNAAVSSLGRVYPNGSFRSGVREAIIAPGARPGIVASLLAGESIGTRVLAASGSRVNQ
jgi:acetylglutamate kinase